MPDSVTALELLNEAAGMEDEAVALEKLGEQIRDIESKALLALDPNTSDEIAKAHAHAAVPEDVRLDYRERVGRWHAKQAKAVSVTAACWNELRKREERYAEVYERAAGHALPEPPEPENG